MTTPINAIDSTASAGAVHAARHHGAGSMTKIADALGMSSDDLKKELRSGKSLGDVATEKGVSHDDLIAAIKQGGTMSDAQAEKIASRTRTAEARGHHGAGQAESQGESPVPPGRLDVVA
ncbi:hypothetical protein ODJ79_21125 [Actinoplanes sp. KI2]|uniref:hypothetical protein n=1 Tax=Actinoplanes sp. KI2 TaxID=2983315 RepID=UPI0021D5E3F3|nr:hypothetical protein [Actinoplanes sp. KI2]MCU7726238.1 hypothetical protein [Actinoplanes sp. KI2]